MTKNINDYASGSGRKLKEDGTEVNIADKIEALANGVNVKASDIQQPTEIQSRYSETIQTHNAVSVGANSTSVGQWVDTLGFNKVGITMLNSASTNSRLSIEWSNDGVSAHGGDVTTVPTSTNIIKSAITETRARYFRFIVVNEDATARTMSAWAYLKV